MKVLVMGLGLHGGGLNSALFLLKRGAQLAITDLRDEQTLAPSIEQLEKAAHTASIRYVLGKHEIDDFKNADMVIKNPGVRPDSPYLQAARRIETDISLFLNEVQGIPIRLSAVTGSKGKSSTASALHWVLGMGSGEKGGSLPPRSSPSGFRSPPQRGTPPQRPRASLHVPHSPHPSAYLGGNITVSPLTFIDDLRPGDDVVLELSSWQLGDLRGNPGDGNHPLKPKAAVLTPIMPDHLDRYGTMEAYVADKRVIYQRQDQGDVTVAANDDWGRSFLAESKATPLTYSADVLPQGVSGGWIDGAGGPGLVRLYGAAAEAARIAEGKIVEVVPSQPLVPGLHQKQNLLAAALALLGMGLPPEIIREGLAAFPGVEHRLELFHRAGGISFYNDSAATIPEAAAAAVEALAPAAPLVLVTGGTDKNLDFSPLVKAAGMAKSIVLLAGSGSDKLKALFDTAAIAYRGPFGDLDAAVRAALEAAGSGCTVALSPGCASFGMFLNEFDRGRKWKEAVKRLI